MKRVTRGRWRRKEESTVKMKKIEVLCLKEAGDQITEAFMKNC